MGIVRIVGKSGEGRGEGGGGVGEDGKLQWVVEACCEGGESSEDPAGVGREGQDGSKGIFDVGGKVERKVGRSGQVKIGQHNRWVRIGQLF